VQYMVSSHLPKLTVSSPSLLCCDVVVRRCVLDLGSCVLAWRTALRLDGTNFSASMPQTSTTNVAAPRKTAMWRTRLHP